MEKSEVQNFEALYSWILTYIQTTARKFKRLKKQDLDDIKQDVFEKILKCSGTLGEKEMDKYRIMKLVNHTFIDFIRQEKREKKLLYRYFIERIFPNNMEFYR